MGCDIHMVLEQKTTTGWIGLHAFPYVSNVSKSYVGWSARNRNYDLFGDLAGVRSDGTTGNEPRGLPDDISSLAQLKVDEDGIDGHSHTHMLLSEAWPLFSIHCLPGNILEADRRLGCEKLFGVDADDADNYRLIIWFDN